ncbi:heme utilization protein [Pseudomonas sp. Kh13]|uniref:heme utilization protein n=1 Tax=Pseudomonas sp. Kh13 TaxID=2093744 RepID=UPI001182BD6C|nr:heme utilization protein [Pseudomonas sp. Kh13]
MKPSMAIKPLVFAIAAIMAVAVQAGQNDRRNDHHNGHHHNNGHHTPPPTKIPVYATANAWDNQSSTDNTITNQGTINEAEMNQSAVGASGNVGVNVAAGNGNQQDNAAAIANAASDSSLDNSFVFGTAEATADVRQYSNGNRVDNWSTQSSAIMSGSADGAEGNVGVNIAGGDLNQQKNTMAIANTHAPLGNATATASADQDGPGLVVNNSADRTYRVDTLTFTKSASGSASRESASNLSIDKSSSSSFEKRGSNSWDASGSKSVDVSGSRNKESSSSYNATLTATLEAAAEASHTVTRDHGRHDHTRSESVDASLSASLDASIEKTRDKSSSSSFQKSFDSSFEEAFDSSYEKSGSQQKDSSKDVVKSYSESSSYDLSNTVSFQVLTPTGWANPVTNTATLSGSVNGGSGNLGVNVAAGVGNQQSNSLAISNTSF